MKQLNVFLTGTCTRLGRKNNCTLKIMNLASTLKLQIFQAIDTYDSIECEFETQIMLNKRKEKNLFFDLFDRKFDVV